MAFQLLLDDVLIGVQAALVEGGVVRKVTLPFAMETPPLDAVFAGRVARKIGGTRDCIVRLENKREVHLSARRGAAAKHVVEGAQVRVQIVRTAFEGKLAEATTKLRNRGRYGTIYSSFRGVQNADGTPSDRDIKVPFEVGLTLSDAAAHVSNDVIAAEARRLADAPLLPAEAMIAALPAPFDGRIIFGSRPLWAQRSEHLKARYPDLADAFVLRDDGPGCLFEAQGVDAWLNQVQSGHMPLPGSGSSGGPSGGNVRFGSVHGITVLDVNAGAALKQGEARAVNIKAVNVIARLLPAADIGGLCVIDFIDMQQRGDGPALHNAIDAAFAHDRDYSGRTDVSHFGCVELRRRKTGPSLYARLQAQPVLDAVDFIRAALCAAPASAHGAVHATVPPSLGAWLETVSAIEKLKYRMKRQIVLNVDEGLAPGTYQVELQSGGD